MHIKIDLKIFLFVIIFLLTSKIEIYALLMIFALIHELGHLLCGLILKFKPQEITIMPYGLKLKFKINYEDYNKKIKKASMLTVKRLVIAFAGPLTNLIIALIVIILSINNIVINILGFENASIIYSNLIIAVFNLIPIYPLDGGKILKECIHIFKGLYKSYMYMQDISLISFSLLLAISSIVILYYKSIVLLVAIIYIGSLLIKTQKEFSIKQKIYSKIQIKTLPN